MFSPRRTTSGLLAALAALISCEAIRLSPSDDEAEARGQAGGIHGETHDMNLQGTASGPGPMPEPREFRKMWVDRMYDQRVKHRISLISEAAKDGVPKLVVGVFSKADPKDGPYRDVIRTTWMAQDDVCRLGQRTGPEEGCSFYVTFVMGNSGKVEDGDDMTILPMPESMNCGKTPVWFQHAATMYPWATHIVKMDMDAFPYVPQVLSVVSNFHSECPNAIGGRPWGSPVVEPNDDLRGVPMGNNFLKCEGDKASGCWSYMQGGMYMLTTELARNASAQGGWWQEEQLNKCGDEDAVAGRAINKYALENDICVSALWLKKERDFWHDP